MVSNDRSSSLKVLLPHPSWMTATSFQTTSRPTGKEHRVQSPSPSFGRGARGIAGRRLTSLSAFNVSVVSGAISHPSKAWRDDDKLTQLDQHLCPHCLCSTSSPLLLSCRRRLPAAAFSSHWALTLKSCDHSPQLKASNRALNFVFEINPPLGSLCRSILGNNSKSFQPLSCRTSSCRWSPHVAFVQTHEGHEQHNSTGESDCHLPLVIKLLHLQQWMSQRLCQGQRPLSLCLHLRGTGGTPLLPPAKTNRPSLTSTSPDC